MSLDQHALYDARLDLLDFTITALADTPDPEFIEGLQDEAQLPDESVTDRLDAGFEGIDAFRDQVASRKAASVADDLSGEFTRLFVGPRPPVLAHETYFRDDVDFLGEGLAAVQEAYSAAGWSPPEDYTEEDDYVAVELAFLRHLVRRQRAGAEETVGFERVFLEQHLGTWVGDLADAVHEHAESPFYPAVADVVAGVAEFEAMLVDAER